MSEPLASKGGPSLDDLLRGMAAAGPPPWLAGILKRCALLRSVDSTLFSEVLASEVPPGTDFTFATLVHRAEFAPLPGSDHEYYVRDGSRAGLLDDWIGDGPALAAFSARLVEFYGTRDPLDSLTHLLFADPDAALSRLASAYDAADIRGDLRTCDGLLRILRNRASLLPHFAPSLFAFLQEREQYYRSRVLFFDEWARSSHYLWRDDLTGQVDAFLGSSTTWLLQIFAEGGLGKTAFLRWLTARRLLVSQDGRSRWPVARVDFDRVNRTSVVCAPELLLVHAADQLDRQIDAGGGSSLFGQFLNDYQRYLPALMPQPAGQPPRAGVELSPREQAQLRDAFCDALDDRRAVLMLDTTEELVLHWPEAWQQILDLLEAVHAACRGVKVFISGRHDIRMRATFAEWCRRLADAGAFGTVRVTPLSGPEAMRYLTEVRHLESKLEPGDEPNPAQGNPFKLALFADRVGAGHAFTRTDLDELQFADVHYLVERIIDRVPDVELQWVLRYAVVPRQLTKAFLHDVLRPFLQREAGEAELDRPREHLPEGADIVRGKAIWGTTTGSFDTGRIWRELRKYASSSSWISFEGDLPTLHPELVAPMRYLLQSQEVYSALHQEAAAYFERAVPAWLWDLGSYRAQRGSANAAEVIELDARLKRDAETARPLLVEALYHHFQASGSEAAAQWHRYLNTPFALFADMRIALAQSLLSGDYLADDGLPRSHRRTERIIGVDTLAEVHFQIARALSEQLSRPSAWTQQDVAAEQTTRSVSQHLEAVQRYETMLGRSVIGAERAELESQVLLRAGRNEEAASRIESALTVEADPRTRIRLLSSKARLQARFKSGDPIAAFEEAARLAAKTPGTGTQLRQIRVEQARLQWAAQRLDEARRFFIAALEAGATTASGVTTMLDDLTDLIEVLFQSARPSEIDAWLQYAARHAGDAPRVGAFIELQRKRLDLATFRTVWPDPPTEDPYLAHARAVRLQLLQLPDAVDALQLATRLFEMAKDLVAAQSCEIDRLEYIAGTLGNLNEAKSLSSHLEPNGPNWMRGQMVLVDLWHKLAPDRAVELWRQAWAESATRADTRERATAFGLALIRGLEPPARSGELASLLEAVSPAGARIALLAPFEGWVPDTPGSKRPPIPALLGVLPSLEPDDPDFALRAMPLACARHFAGDTRGAHQLLSQVLRSVDVAREPLLGRRVLIACQVCDMPLNQGLVLDWLANIRATCASAPSFVLSTHVQMAEWCLERQGVVTAQTIVEAIQEPSAQETDQFVCHYMALRARFAGGADEADRWTSAARELASRLGQPPDIVIVRKGAEQAGGADADVFGDTADLIEVTRTSEHDVLVTVTSAGLQMHQSRHPFGPAIEAIVKSRGSSTALNALLGNQARTSDELRDILAFSTLPAPVDRGLLLRFDDDAIAALPWEWVADGRHSFVARCGRERPRLDSVRWVQRALSRLGHALFVDGVAGPKTLGALEAFDAQHGVLEDGAMTPGAFARIAAMLPPGPLAVVGRPYEEERSLRAGYGGFGLDLRHMWQQEGRAPVQVVNPAHLADGLATLRPEVLHFTLPVSQTGSDLRLAHETPNASSTATLALTPGAVSRMLQSALGPEAWPFIILDVPHAGSRAEALRLLYMRNQFAHQLYSLGRIRGIIATGLAGSATTELAYAIVRSVSNRQDAAGVLRAVAPITVDMPTALFCSTPSIPIWSADGVR